MGDNFRITHRYVTDDSVTYDDIVHHYDTVHHLSECEHEVVGNDELLLEHHELEKIIFGQSFGYVLVRLRY